jgi:TatD DNase family protein
MNSKGYGLVSKNPAMVLQMLIDSHAHLDMKEFEKDREEVLLRALNGGISYIITIGIDLASSLKALELANRYHFVFSSIGYHPHNSHDVDSRKLKELSRLVSEPKIVAWGEIGLDFYRRHSPRDKQIEVFREQLEMAIHFDLPVIIHNREAHRATVEILKKTVPRHRGVIHCFSGDYDLAMEFIEMGYYISIPGTVTYKNAHQVQEVAARIPLAHILLETDAPYLAPVPKRGKRNEPLFVQYTAQKIALLKNMDVQEVALQTSENVRNLFSLPELNTAST